MKSVLKNLTYVLALIGLVSAINFGCTKKDLQFGSQFLDNQYTQLIQLDTLHPAFSTILVDSFITSGSGTALVGQIKDPALGTFNMQSYFQLGAPPYSATATTYDHGTFDSLTLYVKLDSANYYGDTTQPFTLVAYPLTENINFQGNSTSLFNTNGFLSSSNPIGSSTRMIYPRRLGGQDSISIKLSDAFGQNLLSMLQSDNSSIQSNDLFISYFKGIKLTGSQNSSLALGCKDSIEMRLYYKVPGLPEAQQHIATFGLYNESLQFNHVELTRTGPLLNAGIGPLDKEIPSSLTDSLAFLQPLGGNFIKISFPSISSLLQQSSFIQMTQAILYIRPESGSLQSMFTIPNELSLYQTDLNNTVGAALVDATTGAPQTGQLQIDYQNTSGLGTYYSYDVTSYLKSILSDNTASSLKKGLLLAPAAEIYSKFNRLIAGDAKMVQAKAELKIQYLSLK